MKTIRIKSLDTVLNLDIPEDTPKQEAIEYAFKKLKAKGGDRDVLKYLGDQLETSGWGQAIGGTLGSIAGGVGGLFATPFTGGIINPITGSVGGAAAGGASGEAIEQWITGRGEGSDISQAAVEEGGWGLLPAAGTALKGGVRIAAKPIAGLIGKAGNTVAPGLGQIVSGKGVSQALVDRASKGVANLTSKELDETFGRVVGPAYNNISKEIKTLTKRTTRRRTKEQTEALKRLKDIRSNLNNLKTDALTYGYGKKHADKYIAEILNNMKAADDIIGSSYVKDAVEQLAKTADIKNVAKGAAGGAGVAAGAKGLLDDETQSAVGTAAGLGAAKVATSPLRVIGLNEGGLLGNPKRRSDPQGTYLDRVKTRETLGTIADFIPIVGDIKGAKELYDEINKPNPDWKLVGALGGAAVIGLIPGVGDVAAGLIKQGAKGVGKLGKKAIDLAGRVEFDPNTVGSNLGNVKVKPSFDSGTKVKPSDVSWEIDTTELLPNLKSFMTEGIGDATKLSDDEVVNALKTYQEFNLGPVAAELVEKLPADKLRNTVFKASPEMRKWYDELPDKVRVYRGYGEDNFGSEGISWSLDKDVAMKFADDTGFGEGQVAVAVVDKKDISAILPTFNEELKEAEILISPSKIGGRKEFHVASSDLDNLNKGGKLSDKIGLLRREGYPQDQAVAIAHSYKRRGLLK